MDDKEITTLNAEECLKAVSKHLIRVSPIIKEHGKIVRWFAGYRCLAGNKYTNITKNDDFVIADSPEEAISKLLKEKSRP